MSRPYGSVFNDIDNAMDVIGHDDKNLTGCVWKVQRDFIPGVLNNLAHLV